MDATRTRSLIEDGQLAREFQGTAELLDQACPTKEDAPFFNHCMRLAKEMGMGWEEGLRYTIEQRRMGRRSA